MAICPHFLMELHVSLVCAVPNAPWLEFIPQLDDVAAPMARDGGHGLAPQAPGIGIDWDMEKIAALTGDGGEIVVRED